MSKQKYPVTYWYNPLVMDETAIKRMKKAGFTQIIADRSVEENKRIIELCFKEGIEVLVCDQRITEAVNNKAEREKLLTAAVEDYKDYVNVYGYFITDEPSEKAFADLGEVREILGRLDSSKIAYINLLPNYAKLEDLGSKSYISYLENFIKTVKPQLLSYDHYHFQSRRMVLDTDPDNIITAETEDRESFFDNIEIMRDISLKTGIPFMIIILTVEHGGYRNLSEAELRWEVFQSLAYGSAKISYFTYGLPDALADDEEGYWKYANSIVNRDGLPTRHYYEAARINRDLQNIASCLGGRTARDIYHIGKEEKADVKYYEPCGDIKKLDAEKGLTLAFYDDEILLSNKSYNETNMLEMTLTAGKTVSVMDKTTGEWYSLNPVTGTKECFTLTLMPGDGELIKIK